MPFIRGYYFVFMAFVYILVGVCETIGWLSKPHFPWKMRTVVSSVKGSFSIALRRMHLDQKSLAFFAGRLKMPFISSQEQH